MPILVEILTGSRKGHRAVLDKRIITLGRHPENDVVFDPRGEPLVSAYHAEIREVGSSRYVVADRSSSNGTWISGRRIEGEAPIEGRMEITLARDGPVVALMPMAVVPAQVADAPTGERRRAPGEMAYDPMVVGPTADVTDAAATGGPARAVAGRVRAARPIAPPVEAASDIGTAPAARADLGGRVGPAGSAAGAGAEAAQGRPRTTALIRAVAGEAARRTSRRFLIATLILVVLLLGTVVFGVLVVTGRVSLDGVAGAGPSSESTLLAPQPAPALVAQPSGEAGRSVESEKLTTQEIVERNRDAIFLLGAVVHGKGEGFCTGFALTERIIATNAHCVVEMEAIWKLLGPGQGVFAFQNEQPGVRHRVEYAMRHPDYAEEEADKITPDIGLVVIDGRTKHQVRLGTKVGAARLRVGDPIYLLGFPGSLNNTESPVATLTEGVVSRLTDLAQRKADAQGAVLIQHSAFTTKGTSGSPLFDERGEVAGINTGYYRGEAQLQRVDPQTGRILAETVTQDLQSYAIAMRVDMLHDLLQVFRERVAGTADAARGEPR